MQKPYRVLLIMIYRDVTMSEGYEEPGMNYIGAYLRSMGCQVDFMAVNEKKVDYQAIERISPQLIGLPVYAESKDCVFQFCKTVKQKMNGVNICIGGSYATSDGVTALLQCGEIDFAIQGEGEIAFYNLVRLLESGQHLDTAGSLIYREGGQIHANPRLPLIKEIDSLPFQARDILVQNGLKVAHISGSRGCKSKCTFCTSQMMWNRWRGRNMRLVVDEMEEIVLRHQIHIFNFVDNSFEDSDDSGMERLNLFCDEVLRRSLNISYFANFRSEFHKKATPALMSKLRQSGLCGACVGFEAGNKKDLKLYGKLADLDDNEKLIDLFRRYEIVIDPGFINFNPYSTIEKLELNLAFLRKHHFGSKLYNLVNSFQMYHGTRMYDLVQKEGLFLAGRDDPYAYHFMNGQMEALYRYVIRYRDYVNLQTGYAFNEIGYFAGLFNIILNYLKHSFECTDDAASAGIVIDAINQCKAILDNLSDQSCYWFGELTRLAKNGWDNAQADALSNRLMHVDFIISVLRDLRKTKLYIHRRLIKQNPDCRESVLQYF